MHASDVMTANPAVVTPDTSLADAAALMRLRNVGLLPVVHDVTSMRLVGVLTDRDLVVRGVADRCDSQQAVKYCMTPVPVQTTTPTADIHDVIHQMEQWQIRRIPVVGADGRVLGVVSQGDLALRVGPLEPLLVEEFVARVSAPARGLIDHAAMPSGPNSFYPPAR